MRVHRWLMLGSLLVPTALGATACCTFKLPEFMISDAVQAGTHVYDRVADEPEQGRAHSHALVLYDQGITTQTVTELGERCRVELDRLSEARVGLGGQYQLVSQQVNHVSGEVMLECAFREKR